MAGFGIILLSILYILQRRKEKKQIAELIAKMDKEESTSV